jgi:hypothetical protein
MLNLMAARRLGMIGGILFMVLFVPAYLSPPDSSDTSSAPQDVIDYFTSRQDGILFINGLLLIFAAFFLLWFLGAANRAARRRGTTGGV